MTAFNSTLQRPRIMVVDDERLIRTLLRRFLQKQQYEVMEAKNGPDALKLFQEFRPHAVLMDAMMPEMDGFTACARLQELPGGAQTPVLMVTALSDNDSLERAEGAGAAAFITKPIQWTTLRHRLDCLLETHQFLPASEE